MRLMPSVSAPKHAMLACFFIRFLNDNDPLFNNADGYFRYFLQNDIEMWISTVSIAEYCIGGHISELPLGNQLQGRRTGRMDYSDRKSVV